MKTLKSIFLKWDFGMHAPPLFFYQTSQLHNQKFFKRSFHSFPEPSYLENHVRTMDSEGKIKPTFRNLV